jgi:S1-C subfamily serine protease
LVAVCFVFTFTGQAHCAEDFSKVYGKADEAVVLIDFEDGGREVGSGVIVGITESGSALILTAYHVVEGYERVLIYFTGAIEPYDGTVHDVFLDETQDLAVVTVQHPPPGLDVIRFRESAGKKGERIGTIGHPMGEFYTWSDGNITNIHGKYVTHNARLEPGHSGGPVLDKCCRMLGMNVEVIVLPEEGFEHGDEEGAGIALGASSIVSVMEGWFADIRFKEKWQVKKYCSFWQRLYKDPVFVVVEGLVAGGIAYVVIPKPNGEDKIFGEPPQPPPTR